MNSRGKTQTKLNKKTFERREVMCLTIASVIRQKQLTPSSSGKSIVPMDEFEPSLVLSCSGI